MTTLFELEYGIQRNNRPDALRRVVRAFLENIELLAWTEPAAREAGAARAELAAAGSRSVPTTCKSLDIPASLGATLVTNNHREFSRVSGAGIG